MPTYHARISTIVTHVIEADNYLDALDIADTLVEKHQNVLDVRKVSDDGGYGPFAS